MMYMNMGDIEVAVRRYRQHPVLSKATMFLFDYSEQVNMHSDGWAYWSAPVRAAKKLMALIQSGDATEQQLVKALAPIKSFYTRRGNAAGMRFPEVL